MAKRFTDTGKWAKASFGDLSLKMKLVWIYLCDNCDHAGIWDVNLKLLSFQLGETVTIEEIKEGLGDKIQALSSSKLFLSSFIDFQYGKLNPENRAHKSVLDRLEKEGANKVLTRSSQGRKDKDKDKDKDKFLRGGVGESLETLYSGYPCKKGKSPGMKKLKADIKAGALIEDMVIARDRFITHHKTAQTEANYIPQFKTWATSWADWLDPSAGQTDDFSNKASDAEYDAKEAAIFERGTG